MGLVFEDWLTELLQFWSDNAFTETQKFPKLQVTNMAYQAEMALSWAILLSAFIWAFYYTDFFSLLIFMTLYIHYKLQVFCHVYTLQISTSSLWLAFHSHDVIF